MSQYLNQKLWKKAWLLEFESNGTYDAFAFSVPAQTEDFQFAQRINETKTFGGIVYDDYGRDSGKITLSGTSINQEVKIIYRSLKGFKYLKGSEEILYLKEILDKWGSNEKLLNKKIYLTPLDPTYNKLSRNENQVLITNYDFKRTKDNPFAFFYTINFTTVYKDRKTTIDAISDAFDSIQSCIDSINSAALFLEAGLDFLKSAKNMISKLKDKIKNFEDAILNVVKVASGYVEETANIINETVKLGDYVITSGARITLNTGISLFNAGKELNESIKEVVNFIRDFKEEGTDKFIPQDLLESYQTTESEIIQGWLSVAVDMFDKSSEIVSLTKKDIVNTSYAVIPGGENENDRIVMTFGFKDEVVTTSTTWESLAVKHYGDPNLSSLIAVYNSSVGGKYNLEVGDKIYIPILVNNKDMVTNNQIYTNPQIKDNYGKDVEINKNGDINIHLNDYVLDEGVNNLSQAINCRLNTEVTSRIRNLTYGIKANIGSNDIAQVFVLSSIHQTLMDDPRVQSVDEITFSGKGEKIQVDVQYTDINGVKSNYGGII